MLKEESCEFDPVIYMKMSPAFLLVWFPKPQSLLEQSVRTRMKDPPEPSLLVSMAWSTLEEFHTLSHSII